MIGVYAITNKINNKIYIGSSVNIYSRWSIHKSTLKNNSHHNQYLQSSWNKYGEKNFIFSILFICSREILIITEQWFLDNLNPEYNITTNAIAPMSGRKHSRETKEKMRISHTGVSKPEHSKRMTGEGNSFYGKHHSEETKIKISKSLVGVTDGEKVHTSKLTKQDVLKIKSLYFTGKYTQLELGKMFNVSQPNISEIINKKIWKGK